MINAADIVLPQPSSREPDGEPSSPPIKPTSIRVPLAPMERASQASVLRSGSPSRDVTAVFDGLDELLTACRSAPYEDRLAVMITACIERGINTRPRIVGAARRKSFNADKASRFLTRETGKLWRRGKDGVYSLIG